MAQAVALSTELVGQTEDLGDAWGAACADQHICPVEMASITVLIGGVMTQAGLVDLAQAAGLAVIRRGSDAKRPKELLGQLDQAQPA